MWQWIRDFLRLLFPNRCEVCGTDLVSGENIVCLKCLWQIPKTQYWKEKDNPVEQIFYGLVPVESACAFFRFSRGSRYRKLIHKLKYNNLPQVGVFLGERFGAELAAASFFDKDSVLLPVPLHPKRFRRRGYNQSERIAYGMAQAANIPIIENAVVRAKYNETQTLKNRAERLENVQDIFAAGAQIEHLQGKHVIIVDDVITTGATIKSLVETLLKNVNCKISVAVLAGTR